MATGDQAPSAGGFHDPPATAPTGDLVVERDVPEVPPEPYLYQPVEAGYGVDTPAGASHRAPEATGAASTDSLTVDTDADPYADVHTDADPYADVHTDRSGEAPWPRFSDVDSVHAYPAADSTDEPTYAYAWSTQTPPLPAPVDAVTIWNRLRRRKRSPMRRFALYSAGADVDVLDIAPIAEAEQLIQGSLVILTAIVAALSGLAAASFLTAGRFVLNPVTVVVGLAWGVLIYFFDRALVSGTFNPYHFGPDEVDSLRNIRVNSPWAHLIATAGQSRTLAGRIGEAVRVALVASLRVALALATSYIAAEMVLFLVFQPEVNARTAYLQQQEQAQRVAAVHQEYAAQAAARAAERQQLTGSADPDITRLTQQLDTLNSQVDTARHDLGILQAAAAAELDGDTYTGTLSDGTVVKTTGNRGNGAAARSLAQRRDTQQAVVNDLVSRRDQTRVARDARLDAIKTTNGSALSILDDRENAAQAAEKAAVAAAMDDPSAVRGLLIRQAALDKLTYDMHPETLVDDPIPKCTGLFGWLCALRNWAIPPTPMGAAVIAYRVIFFVIEILPITFKVIASLRRRRPYDIAKAALEESSRHETIRMLDRHLHDASRDVLGRHDWRAGGVRASEPLAPYWENRERVDGAVRHRPNGTG